MKCLNAFSSTVKSLSLVSKKEDEKIFSSWFEFSREKWAHYILMKW